MKKAIVMAGVAVTLLLGACSGHSDADKQQIQEAHAAAHQMLDSAPADSVAR